MLALLGRDLSRYLDVDCGVEVTPLARLADHRHPLAAQPEDLSVLRRRRYLQTQRASTERGDLDFAAEHRERHRQRDACVEIAPAALEDRMRAVELCRISYLRPVEGCPTYTEYFKAGDDVPSTHCQIHGGNLRQRAERVIERVVGGLLGKLWSKIKGQ